MSSPEHNRWEPRRLLMSIGFCVLLVVAVVVLERCA